jgi:hypothetical protein
MRTNRGERRASAALFCSRGPQFVRSCRSITGGAAPRTDASSVGLSRQGVEEDESATPTCDAEQTAPAVEDYYLRAARAALDPRSSAECTLYAAIAPPIQTSVISACEKTRFG